MSREKKTPKILTLHEIKSQIDVPNMIQAIEDGFVLYSEGKVVVPPVGFLNFKEPPGDVHIKYGYVKNDDVYVLKVASGFYDNEDLGVPFADGISTWKCLRRSYPDMCEA